MVNSRIFITGALLLAAVSSSHAHEGHLHLMTLENSTASNHAVVQIVAPSAGQIFGEDEEVKLLLSAKGFELGKITEGAGENGLAYSKKGQHLHVIVDNGPYMAVYDDNVINLGKLSPGPHTIQAFASRAWHESVKAPGARKAVTFYVGAPSGAGPIKPGAPLLTYSRPKGEYAGSDAERIMIDFYLTNATLSPSNYKVRVTIGENTTVLESWQPYFAHDLEPGEHTVKLQLLDPAGKPVPGAYNTTERTFTTKK